MTSQYVISSYWGSTWPVNQMHRSCSPNNRMHIHYVQAPAASGISISVSDIRIEKVQIQKCSALIQWNSLLLHVTLGSAVWNEHTG